MLILFYSLGGLASSTIIPMTTALMGELVPLHERSKALGWLVAGPAALYLVGYPLVDRIGDWRKAFLLFALPIILLALVLTSIGIPSPESTPRQDDIFTGYRGILASRSAMACLISRGLGFGVWQIYLSLAASNLRQQFSMSRGLVSYLAIFQSLAYIAGALFAGKIISRFGRRDSTLYLSALLGLSTILRFNVAHLEVAIVVGLIICLLAGMWNTSSQSLNLEQLPGLRGPMMSMTSAFGSTGNALSLSLGGLLLIQYGWGVMGATIGVFGILAAMVLFSSAHDPTRT